MADREGIARLILGPRTSSLEDEYSPVDAALIGAGSTLNNAWSNAQQVYYTTRANFANALMDPAAESKYRVLSAALRNENTDNYHLYSPLAQAYPYATGIGEALPSLSAGLGGGLSVGLDAFTQIAARNVASRWVDQVAKATGQPAQTGTAYTAAVTGSPK